MTERAASGLRVPRYLWLWLAAAALFGYGHLTRVAPGGMLDVLMRDFSVGATALGNLSSMYWYSYAAAQIPGGILLDRYPPMRVMAVSGALCTVGGLIFALAPSVDVANLGRFVTGIGAGALFAGCIKLANSWFAPHRMSLLGGVTILIGMLGATLGQAPLALAVELGGWRATMQWVALAALPFALLLWWGKGQPETVRETVAPVPNRAALWEMMGRTVRARQVWLATVLAIAIGVPAISFTLWTVAYYMQVHGHPRPYAATFTSVALLGWAAGSVFVGWISGHLRRRKPIAFGSAVFGLLGWSLFVAVPDMPEAAHFALMFALGLAAGGIVVCFALVAEHGPARGVGMATGLSNGIVMIASAIIQIIMGAVLDLQWEGALRDGVRFYPPEAHRSAFVIMPVSCLVGAIAALFVRETYAEPQAP